MQSGRADLVGVVEDEGGAVLADGGGAVALLSRHLQKRLFVQIVAAEMLVDFEQDGVDLEERGNGVVGVGNGTAGIDRVAEGAGIAEVMAAGHRRAVRHGEGRKQRMRVIEIDALVAHLGHRRRSLGRHDAPAKAVRHEQDQVTRGGVLRRRRACGKCDQTGGQQYDFAAHQVLPHKKQFRRSAVAFRLVLLCDRIVTLCGTSLKGGEQVQVALSGQRIGPIGGNIGAPEPLSFPGGQP